MYRRPGTNFVLGVLLGDLGLTVLALWLSRLLRVWLPYGKEVVEQVAPNFAFPLTLYVAVPTIWALVFTALAVYDVRRISGLAGEIRLIIIAVSFATLILAGFIYLTTRELSRLLFLYFYLTDLLLLIGWRLGLRFWFHLQRRRGALAARRILIVGAGPPVNECAT